ncbi:MAG: hypothetical protein WDZ51_18815 [Pirellulaceae bacterium]
MIQLIWKAWREQWQGFAAILVIATLVILWAWISIPYHILVPNQMIVELVMGMTLFYSIVASIAFAMGTACGEREMGSLWYTVSLPVSTRYFAAVRLLMGLAMLLLPISLFVLYALVVVSINWSSVTMDPFPQEPETLSEVQMRLGVATMIGMLGTSAFYLPLCVIGCWLRTKAKVLFMGAVLTLLFLFSIFILNGVGVTHHWLQTGLLNVLFPQSIFMNDQMPGPQLPSNTPMAILYLAVTLAWQLTLGFLFAKFYGREPEPMAEVRSRWWLLSVPPVLSKLAVPIRGPRSAMLWLELRQAGPLVLFGMTLVLMLAGLMAMVNAPAGQESRWFGNLQSRLPEITLFFAMVWAAAVGTSLYVADFNRQLGGFWRSRPISPQGWFWCKYVVGLAAMLLVMDGTALVVGWSLISDPSGRPTEMRWAHFACFPLLHALIYTLAVLGVSGTRRASGGILCSFLFWVVTLAASPFLALRPYSPLYIFSELVTAERQGQLDLVQHHYPLVYGGIVLAIMLLAFGASRFAAPLEPGWTRLWLKMARG